MLNSIGLSPIKGSMLTRGEACATIVYAPTLTG